MAGRGGLGNALTLCYLSHVDNPAHTPIQPPIVAPIVVPTVKDNLTKVSLSITNEQKSAIEGDGPTR